MLLQHSITRLFSKITTRRFKLIAVPLCCKLLLHSTKLCLHTVRVIFHNIVLYIISCQISFMLEVTEHYKWIHVSVNRNVHFACNNNENWDVHLRKTKSRIVSLKHCHTFLSKTPILSCNSPTCIHLCLFWWPVSNGHMKQIHIHHVVGRLLWAFPTRHLPWAQNTTLQGLNSNWLPSTVTSNMPTQTKAKHKHRGFSMCDETHFDIFLLWR